MPPLKLEDVLNSVLEETLEEFKVRIREIEEEGLRRLREEGEELRRQATAALTSMQRESNAARLRLVSQATLEARREYLESIDECVKTVVSEALKKIPAIRKKREYTLSLKALLREAIDVVGSEEVIVECAREDQKLLKEVSEEVGKELGVRIILSENALDSVGGVRVQKSDGSIIFDNTVEARLERMRGEIRSEIIRRILSS